MAAEKGHHANRCYTDHNGDFHTNGAKFFNDDEADVSEHFDKLAGCVAGATIVVGDEVADVRAITIQLTDADGNDIAVRQAVQIAVLLDANGDAFVTTGGSTGIAIGTDGALLAIVAKKLFLAISEADGDIDLTWTDTGTEAAFLAVILPNGKMVISAALANAA